MGDYERTGSVEVVGSIPRRVDPEDVQIILTEDVLGGGDNGPLMINFYISSEVQGINVGDFLASACRLDDSADELVFAYLNAVSRLAATAGDIISERKLGKLYVNENTVFTDPFYQFSSDEIIIQRTNILTPEDISSIIHSIDSEFDLRSSVMAEGIRNLRQNLEHIARSESTPATSSFSIAAIFDEIKRNLVYDL